MTFPLTLQTWDCCERTTRRGLYDGVEIIARVVYEGSQREDEVILVIQYRPPIRSYCVEFPAGLIDDNETPEQAAVRELREECGYVGEVTRVSPCLGLEVGLTSANGLSVNMKVDGNSKENQNPQSDQQDEEQIQVVLVPVSKLLTTLLRYANVDKYYIDAKLWTFADGLHFTE